jgi:hypothetical protein
MRAIEGGNMVRDDRKKYRKELLFASTIVATGLVMSGLSLTALGTHTPPRPLQAIAQDRAPNSTQDMAQATQPLQSSPAAPGDGNMPAESKPGGERPTTPAPQPARPDAQAQQGGAPAALPAAPAEKTAAPIEPKK